MPTTHTTIISQDRLILLYALVKGLTKDVRKIIGKEIRGCAIKKQKSTALLFSSLIIGICEASGLKFEVSYERVKNDSQDSQKDCLESIAAATLEYPTVAKAEQATWIEIKLQEFSESINACVQAQKEENKRFWTYLVHFKA